MCTRAHTQVTMVILIMNPHVFTLQNGQGIVCHGIVRVIGAVCSNAVYISACWKYKYGDIQIQAILFVVV